jgi:hypothetical protein
MVATGDWDLAVVIAPGSSIGSESWDPNPPVASGSSASHGSRDPNPPVEELPSCSATNTMLTASEVAAM